MSIEEACTQLIAGNDVMLTLKYDHCFQLQVVFKAEQTDDCLFITKAKLLIDGCTDHIWSVA